MEFANTQTLCMYVKNCQEILTIWSTSCSNWLIFKYCDNLGEGPKRNIVIELHYEKDVAYGVEKLKEREHLHALRLRWIEDEVEERDAIYYDKSLEALQPYQDLEVLSLYRYWGASQVGYCHSQILSNLHCLDVRNVKTFHH